MKKVLSIILSLIMLFSITSVSAVSVSAAEFVKQVIDEDYWYNVYSDNTAEITFYGGTEDIIFIPSNFNEYKVTSIGEEAFVGNEATEIVIPSEVVSIKTRAFAYCYDLEYIEIPDAVTTLGSYVFEECYSLSELILSENVTSIGKKICGSDTKVITKCGTYAQKYAQEKLSNYKIIEHTNMSSGYRTIKKTEALSIKSKYCKTCENNVGSTIKEGLSSSLSKVSFFVRQTKKFSVKTYPSGKNVTYSSNNKKIATVSSKGNIKGVSAGNTKITAKVTINGKIYKLTCSVTVKAMTMDCKNKTAYKPYQLKVLGGSGKITWSSSNTKIAKVSKTGKVTPLKPGTVTIKAKRNGKVVTSKLTVKWPAEKGITSEKVYYLSAGANSTKKIVLKGKSTVTITGKLDSGSDWLDSLYLVLEDDEYDEIWSKFIYDEDGTYKKTSTLNEGTYYLYYDTDCDATIKVKTTTKPSIVAKRKTIGKGYSLKLKTAGVKNGGTWSVSNTYIATINSSGVLKAKNKGNCTVYYKMKDGKKLSLKITVTNPVTCKVISVDDEAIYNDCYVSISNNTSKKIKYIEVYITQYNYKGSKLNSPYSYYYHADEIPAFSSDVVYWWVNDATKTAKVSIKEVKFTDGTCWRP